MSERNVVDAIALKKAEIELKKAEIELAHTNRPAWRDLVSSAPLATVLVAVAGLFGAYITGYFDSTIKELQRERSELATSVDKLKAEQEGILKSVRAADGTIKNALFQIIDRDVWSRLATFQGAEFYAASAACDDPDFTIGVVPEALGGDPVEVISILSKDEIKTLTDFRSNIVDSDLLPLKEIDDLTRLDQEVNVHYMDILDNILEEDPKAPQSPSLDDKFYTYVLFLGGEDLSSCELEKQNSNVSNKSSALQKSLLRKICG